MNCSLPQPWTRRSIVRITKTLVGFAAVVAMMLVLAAPSSAQTPQPNDQAQAQQQPSPIEGELVSVDPDAKTLMVKPASGPELKFTYTETTEISGAQKDAAGLATLGEGKVTVHFTEDAKTRSRVATRIIVAPRQ
jgi:hypothetical protein